MFEIMSIIEFRPSLKQVQCHVSACASMTCALICFVCVQQAWDELFDEHAEPAAAENAEEDHGGNEAREVSPERFALRDRKRQRTQ